jgi:hypothetical protein
MEKNFNETYVLIGLYIDYGFHSKHEKIRLKREKVHKKLRIRWEKGIDRDAFETYFSDHNITKEDIGL